MPRLLKSLYAQTSLDIKNNTEKYLKSFEYKKIPCFFINSTGVSAEDKYLYLSILAANYSWQKLSFEESLECLRDVSQERNMPNSFNSAAKTYIKNLILGQQTLNDSPLDSCLFNDQDLIQYISNLPAPLNLKCLSEILNADLCDPEDKWGVFISNTIFSDSVIDFRVMFFWQAKVALTTRNSSYYDTHERLGIAPEYLTALREIEYKDNLSNIFCLLYAQSTAQPMPDAIKTWQQKHIGLVNDKNPKKIVREFIYAMPAGDKQDFYIARGMDPNFLLGRFLSNKSLLEKIPQSRLYALFHPELYDTGNDRDRYSTLHGESEEPSLPQPFKALF